MIEYALETVLLNERDRTELREGLQVLDSTLSPPQKWVTLGTIRAVRQHCPVLVQFQPPEENGRRSPQLAVL
jgi:hypothetical protein